MEPLVSTDYLQTRKSLLLLLQHVVGIGPPSRELAFEPDEDQRSEFFWRIAQQRPA
ncbi:MAG TPA: hypothetical protein VM115_08340 [Vicinamibacterales bacterium]|nr:hypothetical protein [Vicinamibacterales bacterium]